MWSRRRTARNTSAKRRNQERLGALKLHVDNYGSTDARDHFWQGFRFLEQGLGELAFLDKTPQAFREMYYDILCQAEYEAGSQA